MCMALVDLIEILLRFCSLDYKGFNCWLSDDQQRVSRDFRMAMKSQCLAKKKRDFYARNNPQ